MTGIAVLSLKGGVGKTTVVLGLAGAAAAAGHRVLVVDLDPQANASSGLNPGALSYTSYDVLYDGRPGVAADAVVHSGWSGRVDLLPSEEALAHLAGPREEIPTKRLATTLQGVADRYDLVLFDCPPSLGTLTRVALGAADGAVIVTEASYFGLQGAERALAAVDVAVKSHDLPLRPLGVVVNRWRSGQAEQALRLAEMQQTWPGLVLAPCVPERSAVQQAQGAGVPVQELRTHGGREASDAFAALLTDVLRRTAGAPPHRRSTR